MGVFGGQDGGTGEPAVPAANRAEYWLRFAETDAVYARIQDILGRWSRLSITRTVLATFGRQLSRSNGFTVPCAVASAGRRSTDATSTEFIARVVFMMASAVQKVNETAVMSRRGATADFSIGRHGASDLLMREAGAGRLMARWRRGG